MDVSPYYTRIFREFPAFTNATIRIPVQGMDHVALILDEQWIWRFPVRHEYLETFTREVELLSYLYDKRVAPIPHYIHLAKDRTFGAYAMLRGEECTGQVFANMTPIAQATLAHELAWFLTKLHVIQLQEVRRFGLESPAPDTATELYNDYTACIAPRISEDERVACQTFFTNYAHVPPYPTKTLIHGDFSWWHILVDSHTGSLSGVIDFGDCRLGDPAGDFGSLWTYGKAFVTSVYEQYAGPKDAQFLARSLLYFKKLGLSELSHAVKGEFGSWESMYPFFQKTVATS